MKCDHDGPLKSGTIKWCQCKKHMCHVIPEETKAIVRMYDKHENLWIDVTGEITIRDAIKKLNELTGCGTKYANYSCSHYYKIFPSDTTMLYSNGFSEI